MRNLRRPGARGIAFSRYLEQLINSENNLMVFREDELVFQSQGKQAHHGAWMSKFSHSVSAPKRLLNPFFAFSIQSS